MKKTTLNNLGRFTIPILLFAALISNKVNGQCGTTINTYAYTEDFESGVGAWTQNGADDLNWSQRSNNTPSNNTGPSGAASGTYYYYIEASGSGTGYPNKVAILESPCFDLSGESTATFSFQYHMYGNNVGSLTVQGTSDGTNWSNLWTFAAWCKPNNMKLCPEVSGGALRDSFGLCTDHPLGQANQWLRLYLDVLMDLVS